MLFLYPFSFSYLLVPVRVKVVIPISYVVLTIVTIQQQLTGGHSSKIVHYRVFALYIVEAK